MPATIIPVIMCRGAGTRLWLVSRESMPKQFVRLVHENESIYIPIGGTHRLANPGKIPLEPIEVQVGSYLGEDDIVRFEDAYGRQ